VPCRFPGPGVETAYRYYADMAARQGEMARARSLLIEAVVAEPYKRIVWRELHAWAELNNTRVKEVYISVPPVPTKGAPPDGAVEQAWQEYRRVKAGWQGTRFSERFPEEPERRHSLPEEAEALAATAKVLKARDHSGAADPALALLLRLEQRGLIDAYVLFSLGDKGIARDYGRYRAEHRDKLRAYLDEFVVPRLGGDRTTTGDSPGP
jgi:hypothetical protein